jgi:hypothetical protein
MATTQSAQLLHHNLFSGISSKRQPRYHNKWLVALAAGLVSISLFAASIAGYPPSPYSKNSSQFADAQGVVTAQENELISTPWRIFAPHWSNEDGTTTVFIRNIDIRQGVWARLSLRLKHRTITIPEIYI